MAEPLILTDVERELILALRQLMISGYGRFTINIHQGRIGHYEAALIRKPLDSSEQHP